MGWERPGGLLVGEHDGALGVQPRRDPGRAGEVADGDVAAGPQHPGDLPGGGVPAGLVRQVVQTQSADHDVDRGVREVQRPRVARPHLHPPTHAFELGVATEPTGAVPPPSSPASVGTGQLLWLTLGMVTLAVIALVGLGVDLRTITGCRSGRSHSSSPSQC